jgi:hypothetical protein
MIKQEFIDFLGNEETAYSIFFISWNFFYYYGLNNDKNFDLFCFYSKSRYKNSIDDILSDVSKFETNENVKFPWNLNPEEENLWFPNVLNERNESVHMWRAYMNVWVNLCFNNSSYIVFKKNDQFGLKIMCKKFKPYSLKGFGLLERVNNKFDEEYYLKIFKKVSTNVRDPNFFEISYFIFGPVSLLENSNRASLNLSTEYSDEIEYAWIVESFENLTPPRVFITRSLVNINQPHPQYKSDNNQFPAVMIQEREWLTSNYELFIVDFRYHIIF